MNEQDLPSDSDESDFEYKPSDDENCTVSEEDESGEEEGKIVPNEDGENAVENKNKMTRKPGAKRKSRKRKIIEERCENEKSSEEPQEKKLSMEEEKKKSEALWEDFLKDTGGRTASSSKSELSNIPVAESDKATNGKVDQSTTSKTDEKENKVTVTQIFEFAGEKIKVEKEVPVAASSEPVQGGPAGMRGTGRGRGRGRGGGMSTLSAFVGQLGKKNKLSMLEKSKLDWDSFKKEEGIEEDLKTFNKGKDGYLERQDFLQRADLRQFEIEKEMRAKKSGR